MELFPFWFFCFVLIFCLFVYGHPLRLSMQLWERCTWIGEGGRGHQPSQPDQPNQPWWSMGWQISEPDHSHIRYHSCLVHSFTGGHLDGFQYWAIVHCAAMIIGMHRFFWIGVSGFLGYNTSSGIVGVEMQFHFLVFWGNSILSSTVAAPVCISINRVLGFPSLHNLTSTCYLLIWFWWPFWLVWSGISLWFYFSFL